MELKSLFNAGETLQKVSSLPLKSTKLSFYIAKFMMETEANRKFFRSRFLELMQKNNCTLKENGVITMPVQSEEQWKKDLDELTSLQVEEPKTKIPLSLLVDGTELSPQDMIYLMPFIDEEQ